MLSYLFIRSVYKLPILFFSSENAKKMDENVSKFLLNFFTEKAFFLINYYIWSISCYINYLILRKELSYISKRQ